MTQTSEILSKFELLTGDTTELSSSEELALANRIYYKVLDSRPWEFLRKSATGTTSTSVSYVALPADFTHIADSTSSDGTVGKFVFVNSTPYTVVNMSDRRKYDNVDGYCYIDIVNSRLYFTLQPTTAYTYDFDYIYLPASLTATGTQVVPVFPARFYDII